MADIEIGYKGSTITSINSGGVTTLNTIGTFCEDNITVTFNKTQGEAFTPATTITTNPSITLSATTGTITAFYSGASNITPTVTPGYVSAGTAGTVRTSGTSTYQLNTVAAQTITPTTASQLAVASGRFTTGSVYVGAIPSTYVQPTGTLTISTNGTYDVTEYASVSTNISEAERFAPIYKNLAYRSTLYASGSGTASYGSYTASDISDWCDSLSAVTSGQFANQIFAGSFSFDNVSEIHVYGFGYPRTNVATGTGWCFFNFPSCYSIWNGAFCYNPNVRSAYFPSLTTVDAYAFYNCGIQTISIDSCLKIGSYAFCGCANLLELNAPSCSRVYTSAFCNCHLLNNVNLPACTIISSHAFFGCQNLEEINLPLCTSVGASGFYGCSKLSTINLPVCTTVEPYAFQGCYSLTQINLPACTTIFYSTFQSCSALTQINLPVCTSIGSRAFCRCITLSTINLPACTTISYYAFQSCYNLLSLYLLNSSVVSLIDRSVFNSTPISTYTTSTGGVYGSIFIRASLYESYLTATNWSYYSSRFVSLTDAQIEALGF